MAVTTLADVQGKSKDKPKVAEKKAPEKADVPDAPKPRDEEVAPTGDLSGSFCSHDESPLEGLLPPGPWEEVGTADDQPRVWHCATCGTYAHFGKGEKRTLITLTRGRRSA